MYRMQVAGLLGNTLPQYFTIREWIARPADQYKLWATRSVSGSMSKVTRLNMTPAELVTHCDEHNIGWGDPINISPMLDGFGVTLWCQLCDRPGGIECWYVQDPIRRFAPMTWRQVFDTPGLASNSAGLLARSLLRHYCDPASVDCIYELLDLYPDHAIEFSAFRVPVGTVPHRNTVIWEVRDY